jgi:hypothetical protein
MQSLQFHPVRNMPPTTVLLPQAIGVELDLTDKGLGTRSRRFSMLVEDMVVKVGVCFKSGAPYSMELGWTGGGQDTETSGARDKCTRQAGHVRHVICLSGKDHIP